MKTDKTCLKQTEQSSREAEIRKRRAEGKTYREIAHEMHVSISEISRVLNEPKQKGEGAPPQPGELASHVFQLLEKGMTLSQIVIKLRLEPEVVKDLYGKRIDLNQIDINQPNLERLDKKLENHVSNHNRLDSLLEKALSNGASKKEHCTHNSAGVCELNPRGAEGIDSEDFVLNCAFCTLYRTRVYIIPVENPDQPNDEEE